MMNRRKALVVISASMLGGVAPASSSIIRLPGSSLFGTPDPTPGSQSDTAHSADDRLRKDLAAIDARVNSEEGVPVFLSCVNLVVNNTLQKPPPVTLTGLNRAIAAEFHETAGAWERIRPNPIGSDVGHVIEVLARRDFAAGGTEQLS